MWRWFAGGGARPFSYPDYSSVVTQINTLLLRKQDIKLTLVFTSFKQESCAIAKMTAQCVLYMGALKIFGTP